MLSVKNLTKEFKGFKAVDNVSFEVGEGEIFGLLGPNGAGKTTIIRVIATVLAPTSGTAEILGFDIVKQPEEVRKNIGVLTTDIGVYERFSGRENLRYFGELYGLSGDNLENRINELAKLLDMKDFIDRKSGKYSTGMKQKLAIARSVIHDPKVLIFDEPTSGLDVLASQTVRNFMLNSKESGKCVVFSTHQMRDAEKLCDRVVIIHKGKIIANDKVEVLKSKNNAIDLEDVFMKLVKSSF
ncbi:ATP-binding cassette domain-containing protein [Patescibacteria group bacterium]|nr:ATP-binding cassette domain-containing protein [Patescibacteria group bacterium]